MLKKTLSVCVSCVLLAAVGYARAETFTAAKIKELRKQATNSVEVSKDMPENWAKSPVDPSKMLDVFKPLKLRKDIVLRAYLFTKGGNGNGVVWAMPSDAEFPEPADSAKLENHPFQAPKPLDALDDVMEGIEGDGSAWSYLAASLLRREFLDFAARWHGVNWGTHTVLDADPSTGNAADPNASPLETPGTKPNDWKWIGDRPKSFAPEVKVEKDRVTVTFYTYSGIQKERIYQHVDTYRPGKYRPKVVKKLIAEGQGGYMF